MAISEVFLSAFLSLIIEKFLPKARTFLKQAKGIQSGTINKLESQLRSVEAVLIDAEQRQIQSLAVKRWLKDLEDLFYDVEDLLEEVSADALLLQLKESEENQPEKRSHFKLFGSTIPKAGSSTMTVIPKLLNNVDVSKRANDIIERLEHILSQRRDLQLSVSLLQQQTPSTGANPSWRESTSSVCEPIVYGRDDEKREIINRLKDESSDKNYVVIPIVGNGGIGKTTLAQSVYNDEQLRQSNFGVKAWVCVSDVFDTKRITTSIVNSATKGGYDLSELNDAREKLEEVLRGKRFLIVLDDVWSDKYDDWNNLRNPFKEGAKGSCVIVTTRSQEVAKIMNPNPNSMVIIKGLTDEECWSLVRQHAFDDANIELSPNFAAMKNDILKKCKGLPLAARTLGGLLRTKSDERVWRQILNSNIWSMEESRVLQVLRLSYHYLPSQLKPCFAYCAIFPKDYEFEEKNLVLLWMAQGFLPEKVEERMEDIGHDYFKDLVSRSLFEPGSHQNCYKMHDLISDLAQWAADDIHMVIDGHSTTEDHIKDYSRARHISFHGMLSARKENSLLVLEKIYHLRTFISFGGAYADYTPTWMNNLGSKYLRVLHLAWMSIKVLQDSLGDLKLLRYLDLSFNYDLEELPESMSSLCNLQTLLLRHCNKLSKLPRNMKYLVKLRHLDIEATDNLKEMPRGLGNLTNLQTLDKFIVVPERGSQLRELGSLNCLHKSLTIVGLQNVVSEEDAREAKLYEKSSLDELHMEWERSSDERYYLDKEYSDPEWELNSSEEDDYLYDEMDITSSSDDDDLHDDDYMTCDYVPNDNDRTKADVVEQLEPHISIKKCTLKNYGGVTLPKWLGYPSFDRMVVIELQGNERCVSLPSLGKLPSLKELYVEKMHGIKCIGHEFYGVGCQDSFPALEILSFKFMDAWKEWLSEGFHRLQQLQIRECPLLQGSVPSKLPCLQQLHIYNCKRLSVLLPSLPMLQELRIEKCQQLSSTDVVCSLNSIVLRYISQFHGLKGLVVDELDQLVIRANRRPFHSAGSAKPRTLKIENCATLDSLWPSDYADKLHHLIEVEIKRCPKLIPFLEKFLPSTIRELRMVGINNLESTRGLIEHNICLEVLCIKNCPSLISVDQLPWTLQDLHICQCNKLQTVGFKESSSASNIEDVSLEVYINCCYSLISVDQLPLTLQMLCLSSCMDLKTVKFRESSAASDVSLVVLIDECPSIVFLDKLPLTLKRLYLRNCKELQSLKFQESISASFGGPTSLVIDIVDCYHLKGLLMNMYNFNFLRKLTICDCQDTTGFPEGGLPRNLKSLKLSRVDIEQPIHEWGLHLLTSLEKLEIENCDPVNSLELFPEEGLLPSSLTVLIISSFSDLKSLSLSTLPDLTYLSIRHCRKLESFVDNRLPPQLAELEVAGCPLLKQQCETDPLRHTLSNIPSFRYYDG